MTSKSVLSCTLIALLILLMVRVSSVCAANAPPGRGQTTATVGSTDATDVRGIWSGTFYSRHSNIVPFTMTVEINPDASGHMIGTSSLNSECLKGAKLQVTVTGAKVVLEGTDEEGDNITVRGTMDATGTLLKSTYILNGSASGRCETDDGTGELAKR
jgi:hypothetical protein